MPHENKLNKAKKNEFIEIDNNQKTVKDKFDFVFKLLAEFNEKNLTILENMNFSKADLSYKDQSLMTLLHYASLTGHYSYIQTLINKGYDINKRDITHPVLFYLIDYNYEQCFVSVLKHNRQLIDIYNKDCFGDDMFLYACSKNRGYIFMKHILNTFPHYNIKTTNEQLSNALLLALRVKSVSNKNYLISLGIDPFFKNIKDECAWDLFNDEDKRSYLQNLSLQEKEKIALLVLDKENEKTEGKKRL